MIPVTLQFISVVQIMFLGSPPKYSNFYCLIFFEKFNWSLDLPYQNCFSYGFSVSLKINSIPPIHWLKIFKSSRSLLIFYNQRKYHELNLQNKSRNQTLLNLFSITIPAQITIFYYVIPIVSFIHLCSL